MLETMFLLQIADEMLAWTVDGKVIECYVFVQGDQAFEEWVGSGVEANKRARHKSLSLFEGQSREVATPQREGGNFVDSGEISLSRLESIIPFLLGQPKVNRLT
ncbi:hypothetical protein TanjilG_10601 [Lupinus angustifolius]|uniref:Uncharacterized protein n=1 Tax=Lupinus angustifolius TaxID=3871 RepID=A0A4P1RW09_LUPAN|nr:hypothetical protein TanjilG_10601 [Lupinus angustifolius]